MEILVRIPGKEPLLQNARAVCAMRRGFPEDAVDLLTPLVSSKESVGDSNLYNKIKLNLAEALFLIGTISRAIDLIEQTPEENEHSQSLLRTFQQWKKSLSFWARLGVCFGVFPFYFLLISLYQ